MKKREAPASTGISYLVKKRRFMYTPENTYVAIMAGGVGSRFWPASREAMPKQFLDILGVGKSLLQLTFDRFRPLCPVANIYIVTNAAYRELVLEQLPEIQPAQILAEPSRNNTAPCVAYTALKLHALNPNANLVVAPSDHIILQEATFLDDLRYALEFTSSHDALLTLGIQPTRPDTGYGYIQYDSSPLLRRGAGGEASPQIPEKFPYETAQPLDTEAGLPLTPSKGGGTDHPQTEETDSSPLPRRGAGGEASPQIPEKFPYETTQPLDAEAGLPLTPSKGGGTDQSVRGAGGEAHKVLRFTEKPPLDKAREFLAAGNYLWNAGIFIWSTESLLAAFKEHAAGIYDMLAKGMPYYNTSGEQAFIDQAYPETPNISIDYAMLEKADKVYTIATAFGWSLAVRTWGGNAHTTAQQAACTCHGCIDGTNKD